MVGLLATRTGPVPQVAAAQAPPPAAPTPALEATVSVPRGEGKPSKRVALEIPAAAIPKPDLVLTPPPAFMRPRGPVARFAGVEVELGSVEEAVAFVRAFQVQAGQTVAGGAPK